MLARSTSSSCADNCRQNSFRYGTAHSAARNSYRATWARASQLRPHSGLSSATAPTNIDKASGSGVCSSAFVACNRIQRQCVVLCSERGATGGCCVSELPRTASTSWYTSCPGRLHVPAAQAIGFAMKLAICSIFPHPADSESSIIPATWPTWLPPRHGPTPGHCRLTEGR